MKTGQGRLVTERSDCVDSQESTKFFIKKLLCTLLHANYKIIFIFVTLLEQVL